MLSAIELAADFSAADASVMSAITVYGNSLDAYHALATLEKHTAGGAGVCCPLCFPLHPPPARPSPSKKKHHTPGGKAQWRAELAEAGPHPPSLAIPLPLLPSFPAPLPPSADKTRWRAEPGEAGPLVNVLGEAAERLGVALPQPEAMSLTSLTCVEGDLRPHAVFEVRCRGSGGWGVGFGGKDLGLWPGCE